jgi:membrane protease YdiL (CAAX protease family)
MIASATVDRERIAQHSLPRSIILHLLPGALIVSFYIAVAPYVINLGFPSELALLLGFLLVGIPLELGYLLHQGKRINGRFSLRGVVLYRESMPLWQYVVFFLLLFGFAFCVLILMSPLVSYLAEHLFSWLPGYLHPDSAARYPQAARTSILLVLVLALLVDGIVNPVVEELYFRGYLLPRISRLGWLSPLLNASLFTLAHFWQPYNYPLIFLIQVALVYIVYWKRNIYIAIITHCAGNVIGAVLSLVSFSSSP